MSVKLAALVLVAAAAAPAGAFPSGSQFDLDPVMFDGGGGLPFDGAPRGTSHACDVCHTGAPGRIAIRLEADRGDLFTTGYEPGRQYLLRVVLENEWAGLAYAANGDECGFASDPYAPCDANGFALELDDPRGTPAGTLGLAAGGACVTGTPTSDPDAYLLADGTAAIHSGTHAAQTAWEVCWTAPAAGTSTVTAYLAVVDGNGGTGRADFPYDTLGDDVAVGQVPLAEAGGAAPGAQGGGCAAASDPGLALVALVGLGLVVSRRRRARIALLALGLAGGCVHVRPRERATLSQRAMKFSPDPAEDELDLHMQESREGSEGGYGTAGGGCGCN